MAAYNCDATAGNSSLKLKICDEIKYITKNTIVIAIMREMSAAMPLGTPCLSRQLQGLISRMAKRFAKAKGISILCPTYISKRIKAILRRLLLNLLIKGVLLIMLLVLYCKKEKPMP